MSPVGTSRCTCYNLCGRADRSFHFQQQATQQPPQTQTVPTRADILRGAYGPYRANNDLLFYHLDVRVDPEKKFISGKNTIRFKVQ